MEKTELNKRALEFIDSSIKINSDAVENYKSHSHIHTVEEHLERWKKNIEVWFHLREVLTDHIDRSERERLNQERLGLLKEKLKTMTAEDFAKEFRKEMEACEDEFWKLGRSDSDPNAGIFSHPDNNRDHH
jgi:hypothetical protein